MKIKHNPRLGELPHYDYRKLLPLQGNLKELTDDNYQRLLTNLKNQGLLMPFAVWENPENESLYILDGHQRQTVMQGEDIQPYKVPTIYIEAPNLEEAKKRLLGVASQFGTVTHEGFEDFTLDVDEDYIFKGVFFDNVYDHFLQTPDVASQLLSGESFGDEKPDDNGDAAAPSSNDQDYVTFELIMFHENKSKLIDTLAKLKVEHGFEKQEEALMYLINNHK